MYKYLYFIYFPDGEQVEHEPGMHPCSKAGQQPPEVQEAKHCQQVEEGSPSPLLSTGEESPELTVEERHAHTGSTSARDHKDD